MVRKDKIHIVLLVCALILCLAANGSVPVDGSAQRGTVLAGTAAPADGQAEAEGAEDVQDVEINAAPSLPEGAGTATLYINGALHSDCLVVDGTARMSLGRFASLAGLAYDGHSIGGVTPQLSEDGDYAVVNGRCFYLEGGLYELGGELLWPLRELARMFSCSLSWDGASGSIDLDLTDVRLLPDGESFYDADDVYWLSRIIYAESGNQPLAGQIAVGNVVLNRVESPVFPDSVFDVIFDKSCGVQFSPVQTGSIYAEPSEEAVAAAKLALEGYSTCGGALYFVNPDIGADGWFAYNLTYVASIGDHDFYA